MRFKAYINIPDNSPPVRAWVHEAGNEIYGVLETGLTEARHYLRHCLELHKENLAQFQYVLAAIWGEETDKVIDVFGFKDINDWPGNPDVQPWIIRNGLWRREDSATCGDGIILLGQEEEYRRVCGSLDDYMANPPQLKNSEDVTIPNIEELITSSSL